MGGHRSVDADSSRMRVKGGETGGAVLGILSRRTKLGAGIGEPFLDLLDSDLVQRVRA